MFLCLQAVFDCVVHSLIAFLTVLMFLCLQAVFDCGAFSDSISNCIMFLCLQAVFYCVVHSLIALLTTHVPLFTGCV